VESKWDEAIAQFRKVLSMNPKLQDAYFQLGDALLYKGEPQEAAKVLAEAVRLRPDDAAAHNALGVALARCQEVKRAGAEFETARQLDPNNALYNQNLSCLNKHLEGCELTP
jgi:Flp pilus assembly protein TadD